LGICVGCSFFFSDAKLRTCCTFRCIFEAFKILAKPRKFRLFRFYPTWDSRKRTWSNDHRINSDLMGTVSRWIVQFYIPHDFCANFIFIQRALYVSIRRIKIFVRCQSDLLRFLDYDPLNDSTIQTLMAALFSIIELQSSIVLYRIIRFILRFMLSQFKKSL
jgi:hypothetical protein